MKTRFLTLPALLVVWAIAAQAAEPDFSKVPGVVIDHIAASTGIYIGSPSIAVLPNGDYVASHDEFGPRSASTVRAISHIFRSSDRGATWKHIARIEGAFWGGLVVNQGALYLLSTTREYGDLVIRRSQDGGVTWTEPKDAGSGLLSRGRYHCAPCPFVVHDGRLWRAYEDCNGGSSWGVMFRAFMLSVPVDADLLKAGNWTFSNAIARNPAWLDGRFGGWLEGNAVVAPDGGMVDVLRVSLRPEGGKAAIVHVSADGKTATFDPTTGFVDFPGGSKKFTIRFDTRTKLYWTLSNPVLPQDAIGDAGSTRNTLALMSSPDLRHWTIKCYLLHHPDRARHGWQYIDWLFGGEDIIAAARTAYDDGLGGAHRAHDANFLTFHRFRNFRTLGLEDSVPIPAPAKASLETNALAVSAINAQAATLDNGAKAFSNRDYVWKDVPARLQGWRFTQTAGGVRAIITVRAKRDAQLLAAISPSQNKDQPQGWTALDGVSFCYTDAKRTRMQVYRRQLSAGDQVTISEPAWAGMIVLLPAK